MFINIQEELAAYNFTSEVGVYIYKIIWIHKEVDFSGKEKLVPRMNCFAS